MKHLVVLFIIVLVEDGKVSLFVIVLVLVQKMVV